MTVTGASRPSAAAIAVLPAPVGPTRTATSGGLPPAKTPLQLLFRQLHDGGATVDIVRREGRREQPGHQLVHLPGVELLACLDGRAAREGSGKTLQAVRPPAEPPASQVRHELLETPRRVEARMRIGRGVDDDGPPRELIHLIADTLQHLAVPVDGVELGGRELEG